MNYADLTDITVKSQVELDAIPADYKGRIYVDFGKPWDRAIIRNSSVVARGNSSVVARENSSVVAWGNSSVEAWGNSSVVAWENSSVEAWENSNINGCGNAQIANNLTTGKIQISGNARIVYMPKTIHEFMDFYGVKHTKTKATFYKAVHKEGEIYHSCYDNAFTYALNAVVKNKCDKNTSKNCSFGIHISHLDWALRFGDGWSDLAILELETDIDDIVLPKNSDGKVRTSKATVTREVPLSECGVYGKTLAKRRNGI